MENSSSKNVLSGFAYHLAERRVLEKQAAINKSSYIDFLTKQKLLNAMQVVRAVAE